MTQSWVKPDWRKKLSKKTVRQSKGSWSAVGTENLTETHAHSALSSVEQRWLTDLTFSFFVKMDRYIWSGRLMPLNPCYHLSLLSERFHALRAVFWWGLDCSMLLPSEEKMDWTKEARIGCPWQVPFLNNF